MSMKWEGVLGLVKPGLDKQGLTIAEPFCLGWCGWEGKGWEGCGLRVSARGPRTCTASARACGQRALALMEPTRGV